MWFSSFGSKTFKLVWNGVKSAVTAFIASPERAVSPFSISVIGTVATATVTSLAATWSAPLYYGTIAYITASPTIGFVAVPAAEAILSVATIAPVLPFISGKFVSPILTSSNYAKKSIGLLAIGMVSLRAIVSKRLLSSHFT
jgi:hypothetical protein